MPIVRTKVVETPRYLPAVKTENQLTNPSIAPATYGDHLGFLKISIKTPPY
jgi:hypothetical protein